LPTRKGQGKLPASLKVNRVEKRGLSKTLARAKNQPQPTKENMGREKPTTGQKQGTYYRENQVKARKTKNHPNQRAAYYCKGK
jgi:hypothetical protein